MTECDGDPFLASEPRTVLDPERARLARERGICYLFIPRRLVLEGRPELALFPLNVHSISTASTSRPIDRNV